MEVEEQIFNWTFFIIKARINFNYEGFKKDECVYFIVKNYDINSKNQQEYGITTGYNCKLLEKRKLGEYYSTRKIADDIENYLICIYKYNTKLKIFGGHFNKKNIHLNLDPLSILNDAHKYNQKIYIDTLQMLLKHKMAIKIPNTTDIQGDILML